MKGKTVMNYFATPLKIGRGAYEVPEFATPEKLLAHLDYLGIDRALVYDVMGVDYSPVNGNRELLTKIAPYSDRLHPVFVLTPSDFYEYGTLDWLKEKCRAGHRAFFVDPELSRFRVRELERLCRKLEAFHPVIFLNSDYRTDPDMICDLEYLTGCCPGIQVIICKQMWGGFNRVMDLMWKRQNVGIDISWLHMRDTIELVIEQFGIERLFFGIGHTTQYGAAIAALAHARITSEQREAIAHGNLEKILGLHALEQKLANEPDFADKPMWRALKEGKPIDCPGACDIHTHVSGPCSRGWIIRESSQADALEKMAEFMDRHGIKRICTISERALFGNPIEGCRELSALARNYPGRFMAYFPWNPWYNDVIHESEVDEFFKDPFFVGIKLLAAYWRIPYSDLRYVPVWEYAEKHHLPILMHTWGDAEAIAEIAPRYPHAKFILGHTGGGDYGRRQSMEIGKASSNIYFDFCATFCSTLPWQDMLKKFDRHRFLFGSDAGPHNEAYELGAFLSMPLPDSELIPILSENFSRILADRQ